MPTTNWIIDSGIDRFNDDWPFVGGEKPDPIPCPLCAEKFEARQELLSHLGTAHPLRLPMLRLGGLIGLGRYAVRDGALLRHLEPIGCTSVLVSTNGGQAKAVLPARLASHLLRLGSAHHVVTLRNERALDSRLAQTDVEVVVSIPAESDLQRIESCFAQMLTHAQLAVADVDRFRLAEETDTAAAEYAGALADFVLGMLIKDQHPRSGVTRPFAEFKPKLNSARHVLAQFNRPLARVAVCAIDFSLNHFVASAPGIAPDLRAAHRFYAGFLGDGRFPSEPIPEPTGRVTANACPIDRTTSTIIEALRDFPDFRGCKSPNEELPELAGITLSEYDLAKISALKAASALARRDPAGARPHLRRLADDDRFGDWAQSQLAS